MMMLRRRRQWLAYIALLPFIILAQELQIMNCFPGSRIHVISVNLTCDSPGAYYYGKSNNYRNSRTCKYGDTARIKAFLEVKQDFNNDGILVSVDAGVYGVLSSAISLQDFCEITQPHNDDTIYNDDDAASSEESWSEDDEYCGYAGLYRLKTYFTLQALPDDANFHYIPDLRLRFYNATSRAVAGCAMTGTIAENDRRAEHAEMGLYALGISLLVLGTCFGLMLYLTYRRKKRLEHEMYERRLQEYQKRLESPYMRTTTSGRVPSRAGSTGSSTYNKSSRSSSRSPPDQAV